jgi:FtsP/CotA-like multicopper oxidase with cupredoxin domain
MIRQRLSTMVVLLAALAVQFSGIGQGVAVAGPRDTGIPDYFNTPNWVNSPPLRKFVDGLPGLGYANRNNLGQYIPVAIPDKTTYPGSDYYEIEVGQYREQMHSDLPAVSGNSGGTLLRCYRQVNTTVPELLQYHFLGPLIVSTKDRAVRVKFINSLPSGIPGDLFIPVDTTIMGSGQFEIDYDPETKQLKPVTRGVFTQNRACLHLHGGRTPWISDGTAHQWITPKDEVTDYPKGVSVAYVPDMWFDASGSTIASCAGKTTCSMPGATNNPGPGAQTYYWTNQQSSRFMFYHDHAWGTTRLDVYIGEAAGYLIRDAAETQLIANGLIPSAEIPLVLEDKTYVDGNPARPTYVLKSDPTWIWGSKPGASIVPWNPTGAVPVTGDLWWPHVYMTAQNPYNPDLSGINAYGRWHYGPWFWPPTTGIPYGPVANEYYDPNCEPDVSNNYFCQPPEMPGTPNPSWVAEAFMDTPVVNGTAYPTLTVEPKQYRFRILNAAHDRYWNLQLYVADPAQVFQGRLTEVKMVPAAAHPSDPTWPPLWPIDSRAGGVPDWMTRGPAMIQIGTEGGFLPGPVLLPNQPVNWNVDMTTFTAGIVLQQNEGGGTLMLGPAERADVIVDFSKFAGKTLILYNDAPAPWPAYDPHYDYYTGDPDNRSMGGSDTTLVGYGPNTRTMMQIKVSGSGGTAPPDDYNPTTLANLQAAFKSTSTTKGVFANGQEPIIVGQTAYNTTYNKTFPATAPNWGISRITDTSLSFMRVDGSMVSKYPMKPKAMHDEMGAVYDDFGRASAKIGLELPFANNLTSNFVMQSFVDPPTEIVAKDQVQIWKISHNGVDTHPIHFHIFDVQLINRVGWDGFIYLPDANELGWKDTIRISPLEDTIVALRPAQFTIPFTIPDSIRPFNPAFPLGSPVGFSSLDPLTGQALIPATINEMHNFGHEYLWHCHILSHEENDMMRAIVVNPNTKVDILWRNTKDGKNLDWFMDGITPVSQALLPLEADQNWKIVGKDDFNGDGKPDILWRNTLTGANRVWYMDGNVRLGQAPILPIVADQNWKIVGTGDFNGDGKPDILWRNSATGQNKVWYMNKVIYSGSGMISTVSGSAWTIVGTGDFNGDGKPDILWRNTSTGAVTVWYMNGVNLLGSGSTTPETVQTWKIVGIGDFNADIKPDILWRNSVSGANRVWYMDGMVKIGEAPLYPTITDLNWAIVN